MAAAGPARPGDSIRTEATVVAVRSSTTRNDRGYVTFDFNVFNQRDEIVTTYRRPEIIQRRPQTPSA